jgi:hypothetical protein
MGKPKSPGDVHPDAPAGGGGPGHFRSPKSTGANPDFDPWKNPLPRGRHSYDVASSDSTVVLAGTATPQNPKADAGKDPAIEALDLGPTAKKAAYQLKKKFPTVVFTSGRRNKEDQARAMASNVVENRTWIKETYIQSAARDACQKWLDGNPDKTTKDDITAGLKSVLEGLTDAQLRQLSKHLSGDAFDVQPVEKNAGKIKKAIRKLPGCTKFLDQEGGLVRWHAQF